MAWYCHKKSCIVYLNDCLHCKQMDDDGHCDYQDEQIPMDITDQLENQLEGFHD